MSQDIFFELGLEELPSGLVKPLGQQLLKHVLKQLETARLGYSSTRYFATPRRLAFMIEQVDSQQANQFGTRRGPAKAASHDKDGQPTQALLGFARSCGVPLEALRLDEQEKGAWWVYDFEEKGQLTKDLLPLFIQEALSALNIPKPMRWGSEKYQFARPAHWAILMWGNEPVNASFFGIHTHLLSYGHRFLHPEALNITYPRDYEVLIKEDKVWVDFDARREEIKRQIHEIAQKNHWVIPQDEDLLDELTSIVEWPVVMVGQFDAAFLEVPAEVLIASMKGHQKCLPIYNQHEELQPCFIFVSNIESIDPCSVVQGNEKVM
ncbi:MAG: glycyl-tRNA synthetase beta chain, partial [Pseudomonadota bacterium]|nr:glycyl-tRNA synthetase beta chain [Pseudomonadota bacterium]